MRRKIKDQALQTKNVNRGHFHNTVILETRNRLTFAISLPNTVKSFK
jgi:hypothetical protein